MSVPPSTSTPTTAVGVIYRVKRGDTLTSIARRFRVAATTIRSTNHIANPDRLVEGQRLTIPPRPPLKFVVSPSGGPPGQSFELRVNGAQPGESITFQVESPNGKFTGPPHAADAAGTVTASYQTSLTDPAGPYRAIAHGNQGTDARAEFVVVATAPTT